MKRPTSFSSVARLLALCAAPLPLAAQVVLTSWTPNMAIPDGDASGLIDSRTVSLAPSQTITDLKVHLTIAGTGEGAFNGDYFVSLQHDSGYTVLLNRAGSRAGRPAGYGDNGFSDVVFADSAPGGDVHVYRQTLGGSHLSALTDGLGMALPLTASWSPDGRTADPSLVRDTSPRQAMLDSFRGLPASGQWTLFIADLSGGGTGQLAGWGLEMHVTPVPEPGFTAVATGGLLLGWLAWRRFFTDGR